MASPTTAVEKTEDEGTTSVTSVTSTSTSTLDSARAIVSGRKTLVEREPVDVAAPPKKIELSVVIPAIDEAGNIRQVVEGVHGVCRGLCVGYEIFVVDGGSTDTTPEEANDAGARVIRQSRPGYGSALKEAFAQAAGGYVLTMDSDLSHPPNVIRSLYRNRRRGEIVIASRYIKGGLANMPWVRKALSVVLNAVFSRVLDLPVADMSSGFRIYKRSMLREIETDHDDFSFLQEILVKGYAYGYGVHEVPFHYFPRVNGVSKARIFKFGISYLKLLFASWRLRNSVESADYDERAYDSLVLPQRLWQRWRYKIITAFAHRNAIVLDIGCGSSRIFEALPGAVGLDINIRKLRYRRGLGNQLVRGTLFELPFPDEHFDQVICSEVIEHVPQDERLFKEFHRVVRPGGTLILGTPDYAKWQWNFVEWVYGKLMPGGYADEHITHYTLASLTELLDKHGFETLGHRYVFQGELIIKARKRVQ